MKREGEQLDVVGIPPADASRRFRDLGRVRRALDDRHGETGGREQDSLDGQGNGARRAFAIAGQCGIPTSAVAAAVNVTVAQATGAGDLRVGPAGFASPTSTINFTPGRTSSDVTGYFE